MLVEPSLIEATLISVCNAAPIQKDRVLMAMKHLSLAAAAILLAILPRDAEAQTNLFRHAFACPDRGPSSVCIYGTIPHGKQVTLLAKNWKSSGVPKEEFPISEPNSEFDHGVKTITHAEAAATPPKDALIIAILAAADVVTEVRLEETQDGALLDRIGQYIKSANTLNLGPDIHLLKTRLLRASPTVLLSETFLSQPDDVAALEKELPTGCNDCDYVPLLVGSKLEDLFKDIRSTKANSVEHTCGGFDLAYTLSGRMHLVSHASACESDSFFATLIHDLSGPKPKLVFKAIGGF
jgi:hypothetical protein